MKSDQAPRTRLCAVGVIVKVFGIKGEVKIHSYSRTPEEVEELGSVLVGTKEEDAVERRIERVSAHSNGMYVKFQGISDRNASESLIGHFLFVEESNRKRLNAGEYYVDDLIGVIVYDTRQRKLGTLRDVADYGTQTLYVVRTEKGDILLPAVKKIVREVDVKKRTMTIDPPEGLFDGSAASERGAS